MYTIRQKTKVEIIRETNRYYSRNPKARRGLSAEGTCAYLSDTGKKCAVGRYQIEPDPEMECSADSMLEAYGIYLEDTLCQEYRGHPMEFWVDLQNFHDTASNWTSKGKTLSGKNVFEYLIKKYK